MMIDVRSNETVLKTAGTWKDRKDLREFMTDRTWHYHDMNDHVLRTRSCVLRRFWRVQIFDKNGRRVNISSIAMTALVVSKVTFSFAMTVMDKVEGDNGRDPWMGRWREKSGIKNRSVHVNLNQRSTNKRTKTQPGNGGFSKETNDVHYAMHKLDLYWRFRRSRMDVRKYKYPVCYIPCVVSWYMFWCSRFYKNEWNIRKTRFEN